MTVTTNSLLTPEMSHSNNHIRRSADFRSLLEEADNGPMSQSVNEPVLLTIAGFDPSAGAGIVADLKTFAAHGCYGVAAITAITVQNTAALKIFIRSNRMF